MNPLTTNGPRQRSRARLVLWTLAAVVALAGAATVYAVGGFAGGPLDRSTVTTAGLPAPVPPPDGRPRPTLAVDLATAQNLRVRLDKPPRAGLLFDLRTGKVLWSRNPLEVLPIASLTKVMSAILVAERTAPGDRAKVTRSALGYSGSGVGVLPRGRRVPVDALLTGMLLVSGNDAAIALADHVAGTQRAFVALMNRRAAALGLRCTRFVSSHGLEAGNRSCPADLAALARLALSKPRIARVARERQAAVRFPIAGGRLYLNSTNPLLRLRYRGTVGLKTGYTARAGRSYIGVVRRGGRTLGVVLLNSPDTGLQAKQLFDRAFRGPRVRSRREGSASRTAARGVEERPKLGG